MARKRRKKRKQSSIKLNFNPSKKEDAVEKMSPAETELARVRNTLNTGLFSLKERDESENKYTMIGFGKRDLKILLELVDNRMKEIAS